MPEKSPPMGMPDDGMLPPEGILPGMLPPPGRCPPGKDIPPKDMSVGIEDCTDVDDSSSSSTRN